MGTPLEEAIKKGTLDPEAIKALGAQAQAAQAQAAGLTKKVIHIELDMVTGNMKYQASPGLDSITHLGMLDFYRATVVAGIMGQKLGKTDPPAGGATGAAS
jgi:hypothetical protein